MAKLHVLLSIIALTNAAIYEYSKTNLFMLNPKNFDKIITKKRDKYTSIIHFYKASDGRSETWSHAMKELASDWQGVYTVGAVDCDSYEELCEAQGITEYPKIKVYPPFPAPVSDYEGEVTAKGLNGYASRFVQSKAFELTNENYKVWLEDKPAVPKVILFTEKKGVPTLFKALSVSFEKKMEFAVARKEDNEVINKFKIFDFPKIVIYKTTEKKTHEYNGELKFRPIHDWLNIFSETFVAGGGEESITAKPWLVEALPQLHKNSADDICFKQEGLLCAIYFLDSAPSEKLVEITKEVTNKFSSAKDRGASVKFMWIDFNTDKAFSEKLEAKPTQLVFLKHGKRNRFLKHEGEFTSESIGNTLNKIMGGDGKFTNIKGGLPQLSFKQ